MIGIGKMSKKTSDVDFEIKIDDLEDGSTSSCDNIQPSSKPTNEKIQSKELSKKNPSIIDTLKELMGKKKEAKNICSYKTRISRNQGIIILDCENCELGKSSITDSKCRRNIFRILISEPTVSRLVLSQLLEIEYEMENLEFLYLLARFIDNIKIYKDSQIIKECDEGSTQCRDFILAIINSSTSDPVQAYLDIKSKIKSLRKPEELAKSDKAFVTEFILVLEKMVNSVPELSNLIKGDNQSSYYYEKVIKPLVRPRFSSSRIYTIPPSNVEILEAYDVQRHGGRIMPVTLYELTDKPESLYFALPAEYYNMETEDLELIEAARKKLMKYRPRDMNFSDSVGSREYFRRLGRQMLSEKALDSGKKFNPDEINMLSDVLAKYTTGLGILEDVLSDERITDVYVNSPVDINPVHIKLKDGEECYSNIYLSQDDIDSMITRFRAISGRPFGEANPVLDMDLAEFKTRVSVIGDPLAAGGMAYAFRKHARDPWTLPKLINKGFITPMAAGLLSFLIDGQSSILVAGGVGSGKTSLLSAMLLEIPQKYRILTIEDTPELPIETLQKLGWQIQGMHIKSAVGGSEAEVKPEMALRAALRMGNATLVLGEVRGPEVKVLYEAMQVGTAGNSVIGTIHGASARNVFERIVNSLDVPVASFRATDAVIICQNVRVGGTMKKEKRVVEISEVKEGKWDKNPDAVDIFNTIMKFESSKEDGESNGKLVAADLYYQGKSTLVNKIAKKWDLSVTEVTGNIKVREMVKEKIANTGLVQPKFVEADMVGVANNMFWHFQEKERDKKGKVNYDVVYSKWNNWYEDFIDKNK